MGKWTLLIAICSVFSGTVFADEVADRAREIIEKHGAKVLPVRLVFKETSTFGNEEYVQETYGTVISPDGLIVCSLLSTDPAQFFNNIKFFSEGEFEFNMDTTVVGATVILADSREVNAKIVLRDKDLDLAFFRLKEKPENDLPYIDLQSAGSTKQFEELFFISRMGKVAKRIPSGFFARVLGVLEKPRLLYIMGEYSGDGEPAYTLDGDLIGILVNRSIPSDTDRYYGQETVAVIVPAADVHESAQQAPEDEIIEEAAETSDDDESTGEPTP